MKFGIVGGLGPASTVVYYQEILAACGSAETGYPPLVIESVNMTAVCDGLANGAYAEVTAILVAALQNLQRAGATVAAVASNTPHILLDDLRAQSPLPILSIVDAVCAHSKACGYRRVLVLGTAFTMQDGLYARALPRYGIAAITPTAADIARIQQIIFPNLENGIIVPADRAALQQLAEAYIRQESADAVLLGCTELPLMLHAGDLSVPVIDSTAIHIQAIVQAIRQGAIAESR